MCSLEIVLGAVSATDWAKRELWLMSDALTVSETLTVPSALTTITIYESESADFMYHLA
jgi:hypothetical protein